MKAKVERCLRRSQSEPLYIYFSNIAKVILSLFTAASELFQLIAGQYDMDKNHPEIAQYMKRVKAETEPHFSESIQRMEFVKDQISKGKIGLELLPTDPNVL